MRQIGQVFLLLLMLLLVWTGTANGDTGEAVAGSSWNDTMRRMDLKKMEEFKNKIDGEITGYLREHSIAQMIADFVKGDWELDFGEVLRNLGRFAAREVMANGTLLGKIMVLAVVSALLVNLQSSFGEGQVSKIASLACFLSLSAISLSSFKHVLNIGQDTINTMSDFMAGVLPQMMLLVTGLGHINTAASMFPVLIAASTALARGMTSIVFPLIVFSAILGLLNVLADTVKVQRLGKLMATLAEGVMGLMITIFIGILTLKGLYGTVLDRIALKTGKFVADSFFPVVGGYLADALEAAAAYMVLLKQAVGIIGMLIVFGIFIFPIIKIGVIAFMYKLVAAVIEPLGDSRTAKVLDVMGNHLLLVLGAVTLVGLMSFICIAILSSLGNSVILLR